jgi:hypothetical protein
LEFLSVRWTRDLATAEAPILASEPFLFVVGASRAFLTEAPWFRAGTEMFLIGALRDSRRVRDQPRSVPG